MKNNDFIVAAINNPGFGPADFRAAGMDTENTQILSKDEYLKSDYIKTNNAFKDANGDFSEKKFSDFYDYTLDAYQTFSKIDDGFLYDQFDARRVRDDNAQVKSLDMVMYLVSNPSETTVGQGFVNQFVESPFSTRELAELNTVYDTATGEFCTYSPNDNALFSDPVEYFKDLFREPLVLATYDDDGLHEDPMSGQLVGHKKGQPKINDEGKYYYETLNGRSLAGKQVLSKFDTLTVDGDSLNKLDFFDSDDREKSIGGTIMKGVATVAPLFMGPVGAALSTALVLREFGKVMPMVDGMISAVTGNNTDTAFSKWANNWAARMTSFTQGVSDYSQQNMFSFENFANLASDVALQWGLLQLVAKGFSWLKGNRNIMEKADDSAYLLWQKQSQIQRATMMADNMPEALIVKAVGKADNWKTSMLGRRLLNQERQLAYKQLELTTRLGQDASLVYMALVSNPDVYSTMLEHGTTKREAAFVTMASTIGMFSVDKFLGLGEMFFDEANEDMMKSIRITLQREAGGPDGKSGLLGTIANMVKGSTVDPAKAKPLFKRLVSDFHNVYTRFWEKAEDRSLGFLGKAIGEGLEEVSEELTTDLSKQLYELAASWQPTDKLLNDLTTENVGAFNDPGNNKNWFKELFARYSINFLGGLMGGGIFYAKGMFDKGNFVRDTSHDNLIDIVYLYGKDNVMKVLDKFHDRGSLASTKLSMEYQLDEKGNRIFLSANEGKSQNDIIYNNIKNSIDGIDRIINDKELIRSDSEMVNQLTLGDARFQLMSNLLGNDYTKGLRQQAQNLVHDYVKANQQIEQIEKEIITADSNIQLRKKKEEIRDQLKQHADDLKKQLDKFKSGELAFDYMNEVLFNMDDRVSSAFSTPNFTTWLSVFKKNQVDGYDISPMTIDQFNKLNQLEKEKIRNEYREYIKSKKTDDSHLAYLAFKFIRDITRNEINGLNDSGKNYQEAIKAYQELKDEVKNPLLSFAKNMVSPDKFSETASDAQFKINWDELYEFESDVNFNNRNKKDNETDEQYELRRANRIANILNYLSNKRNNDNFIKTLLKVEDIIQKAGYLLDNTTRRQLKLFVGLSLKEIVRRAVQNNIFLQLNPAAKSEINELLELLPNDMNRTDVESIMDKIRDIMIQNNTSSIQQFINKNIDLILRLNDKFYSIYNNNEDEIKTAIDYLINVIKSSSEDGYGDIVLNAFKQFNSDFVEDENHINTDALLNYLDDYLFDKDKFEDFVKNGDSTIQDIVSKLFKSLEKSKGSDAAINDVIDRLHITDQAEILLNDNVFPFVLEKLKSMHKKSRTLTDEQKRIISNLIKPNYKRLSESLVERLRMVLAKIILNGMDPDHEVNIEDLTEDSLEGEYGIVKPMVDLIIGKNDDSFNPDRINMLVSPVFPYDIEDGKKVYDLSKFQLYNDADGKPDFNFLCNQLNLYIGKDIFTPDFIKSALVSSIKYDTEHGWTADVSALQTAFSKYGDIDITSFINMQDFQDDDIYFDAESLYKEDSSDDGLKNVFKQDSDRIKDFAELFVNGIRENPVWQYLDKIDRAAPITNPIVDVLNKLNGVMGNPILNVEQLMDDIDKLRDSQGYQEFTLKPTQIEELLDAYRLLSLARSLMYASYDSQDFQNPFPHNKTMNDVILKNGLKIDLFPILDPEVAQTFIYSISEIMATIGEYDASTGTYTAGSFLEWNRLNGYNKKAALIKSKAADVSTHLLFYANNQDNFTSDDGSINLLPGLRDILNSSDSQDKKLFRIQKTFYDNVKKYLDAHAGLTIADLFDKIKISEIIDSDKSTFRNQSTANLNGELTFGQLTPLDKIMICITDACMSIESRKQFQADFIKSNDNFASLSNLEIISEKGLAYIENPTQFQAGLDWVGKHYQDVTSSLGSNNLNQSILHAVVMTGNGGAGKTDVCIRQQLEYAKYKKGLTDDLIVVSGPTKTQVNNLAKIGIGTASAIDEILKKIYGETLFNEIISETTADDASLKHLVKQYEKIRVIDSSKTIAYENTDPKVIVVDEASWLDSVRLSMLSKYAKDTGASLILVGDDYQSGHMLGSIGDNFNPEIFIAGRTPRLSITLRDCNILKYNNTLTSANVLNTANNIFSDDPNVKTKRQKWIDNLLSDYSFTYFDGDVINGDMVVSSLTDEMINKLDLQTKLKSDGTRVLERIAYIGNNDATFSKLKAKFGDDMVDKYTTIKDIQGNEFSNIIVETDVRLPKIKSGETNYNFNILNSWVQNINTLSTRGKNAAIFIDPSGELAGLLHNMKDPTKNNKSNFDKDAITAFNENANATFVELGITGSDYKSSAAPSTTSTTPAPAPATSTTTTTTGSVLPATRFSLSDDGTAVDDSENVNDSTGEPNDASSKSLAAFAKEDASDSDPIQSRGDGKSDIWANSALVYGDNTISGMPYQVRETELTVNGKTFTKRERVYAKSDSSKSVFYDVDAFALIRLKDKTEFTYEEIENTDEEIVDDEKEKQKIFSQYNTLKLSILNKVDVNSSVLNGIVGSEDGCIMTRGDYLLIINGSNMRIEITAYDKGKFNYINMNHLSEDSDKMAIAKYNNIPLVMTLVAEYKLGDTGRTGKITLGFLANPELFKAKEDSIKKRLLDKIDSGRFSEAECKRMSKYINALESKSVDLNPVMKYQSIVDNYTKMFEIASQGGTIDVKGFSYNSSEQRLVLPIIDIVKFSGLTGVYNNIRNVDGTVPLLRLSNMDSQGNRLTRGISFKEANSGVVISDVYVFRKSMNQNNTAADNGRCCIFVSTNPALKPNELCSIWCNQLMEGYRGAHSVRMIKLNNAGVTWSDLVNFDYRKLYRTYMVGNQSEELKMKRIPFASDIFAIRQIIALLNWRADIDAFRASLNFACNEGGELHDFFNSYNKLIEDSNKEEKDSFIKQALILLHETYVEWRKQPGNEEKTETDFQQDFANASISGLDSRSDVFKLAIAINKFNNSLDNQCRRFRLGIGNDTPSVKGQTSLDFRGLDRNGSTRNMYQIRRMNVSDSGLYADHVKKGTHVYGIYLTPDLFNQFDESTSEVYSIIEQMGILLKSYNEATHEESDLEARDRVGKKVIINGHQVSTVVALFKNFEGSGNNLRLSNDPEARMLLRKLPTILLRLGGRAHALRLSYETTDSEGKKILVLPEDSRNLKSIGLRRIVRKNLWQNQFIPLYKEQDGKLVEDKKANPPKTVSVQHTMDMGDNFNLMMELCFHGTTMNVVESNLTRRQHKVIEGKERHSEDVEPRSTDAEFGYGFLIDPQAKSVNSQVFANASELRRLFVPTTAKPYMFTAAARIAAPTITIEFGHVSQTAPTSKPTVSPVINTEESSLTNAQANAQAYIEQLLDETSLNQKEAVVNLAEQILQAPADFTSNFDDKLVITYGEGVDNQSLKMIPIDAAKWAPHGDGYISNNSSYDYEMRFSGNKVEIIISKAGAPVDSDSLEDSFTNSVKDVITTFVRDEENVNDISNELGIDTKIVKTAFDNLANSITGQEEEFDFYEKFYESFNINGENQLEKIGIDADSLSGSEILPDLNELIQEKITTIKNTRC